MTILPFWQIVASRSPSEPAGRLSHTAVDAAVAVGVGAALGGAVGLGVGLAAGPAQATLISRSAAPNAARRGIINCLLKGGSLSAQSPSPGCVRTLYGDEWGSARPKSFDSSGTGLDVGVALLPRAA